MTSLIRSFRCVCSLAALAAVGLLSPVGAEVPTGGVEMIAETTPADAGYYDGSGPVTTREIVTVAGQTFDQATQVATLNPTGQYYSSAVTFTSDRAVVDGDVVLLHFFARMVETMDESGTATMEVYVEGPGPDYTKSVNFRVNVAGAWQEYFVPFEVSGDYAVGELGFKFGFGATGRPQVMAFGGVEAWWYGTSRSLDEMPRTSFEYPGRAADAPWRAEAAARIDQYRKGDFTVRVVDGAGAPVEGAEVRVRMTRHAFEFGTAMVASRLMDDSSADNATYRQKILELFTAGTLENDTKWPAWIGEYGSSFNPTQTVAALEWTQEQDLTMRGHVLVWPSVRNLPDSIGSLVTAGDASVPGLITDHIADVMSTTAGFFTDWDVMNEPFDNYDVMETYGYDLMAEWFRAARAQDADVGLFVNDYGILSGGGLNEEKQDAYAATIRRIQNDGGPITGIGFQGHFSGTPTGITKVWEILERYATEFPELDLRITEFDITGSDESLKADFLEDFFTIAFSHPRIIGVQLWGFWENAHWRAESSLYDAEWNENPMGQAYRELVHGTWTTDVAGVTGADGVISGRGFAGDYVVEDMTGRRLSSFELAAQGEREVTVVWAANGSGGSRLSNLSTRGRVDSGDGRMVAGFVVEGDTTKDLVIRAVGPKLGEYGLTGTLADPTISLFRAGEIEAMAQVDGWPTSLASVFDTLGAFALDDDTASAATLVTVEPGGYTAVVEGVGGGTGLALVEVYDAATGSPAQLSNLSTRGTVGTGAEIMVAGFVIDGDAPQRVMVRGVGPTLADFQVEGALAAPVLRLKSREGDLLATNAGWGESADRSAIVATAATVGAFALPEDSGDAALLVDLDPGAYTVELAGEDDTTGVGLIEVYRVP